MNIGSLCSPLELFPGMVNSGCLTAGSARRYLDAADRWLPERLRLRPTPARLVSVAFLARPSEVRETANVQLAALSNTLDAVRLSLHVLAATIWVGGQLVVAGILPKVRSLGGDASKRVARAFGRIQWPAYAVLLITGIWNVLATKDGQPSAWNAVLDVKIAIVVLAGMAAYLHQRPKSTLWLAAWGAVTTLASTGALVLGVLLAG
jgi:hypothetical protein